MVGINIKYSNLCPIKSNFQKIKINTGSTIVGALIPNAFGFRMIQSCSIDEWFGFRMVWTKWLPFCSDFEWSVPVQRWWYWNGWNGPFKIRTIPIQNIKTLVFKWIEYSNVRYSSPHCIQDILKQEPSDYLTSENLLVWVSTNQILSHMNWQTIQMTDIF